MNKDQVLFWIKGYMESMLISNPPNGVRNDLENMLKQLNKAVEVPSAEKQLLTEKSKVGAAELDINDIKRNATGRIYPGDIYTTDIG